ncbi:hypothetical protein L6164_031402 [Bauhinia variegata]|uniref:Uncharacterized protein n=1 Tax=Bauhinia variegata TaxID=167791 RepID=A0ACB9LG80_BAUVA|nr:hypothetical protein L6164_031402 [Bauhinia variegata]
MNPEKGSCNAVFRARHRGFGAQRGNIDITVAVKSTAMPSPSCALSLAKEENILNHFRRCPCRSTFQSSALNMCFQLSIAGGIFVANLFNYYFSKILN